VIRGHCDPWSQFQWSWRPGEFLLDAALLAAVLEKLIAYTVKHRVRDKQLTSK